MKYDFVRIDEDTTELTYKDKKFTIKKDIDLEKRMQEAVPRARILMNVELSSLGKTKKDLVIVRQEGNKTYYDNSNIIDAEEQYQAIATMQVFDEIVKKYCDMTLTELMQDIGLNVEEENKENEQFGIDLLSALTGKSTTTPSGTKTKETK